MVEDVLVAAIDEVVAGLVDLRLLSPSAEYRKTLYPALSVVVIPTLAVAVVVEPEGAGRISVKSMVEGKEIPTVGVAERVETPESPSVAEAPEGEAAGANSIKPTSRARTAPLVPNK